MKETEAEKAERLAQEARDRTRETKLKLQDPGQETLDRYLDKLRAVARGLEGYRAKQYVERSIEILEWEIRNPENTLARAKVD